MRHLPGLRNWYPRRRGVTLVTPAFDRQSIASLVGQTTFIVLWQPSEVCFIHLSSPQLFLLHFAWGIAEAKCILVMPVCLSVCLSLAAFPHYCMDLHVTWGNGRGCRLVVRYWAYLQSMHGFCCCDSMAPNAKCQWVLVLALCQVLTVLVTAAFIVLKQIDSLMLLVGW